MAFDISSDTVSSLPSMDTKDNEYFGEDTRPGTGLNSSNPIFWGPSQHTFSSEKDLSSLNMLSSCANPESYNGIGTLMTTSFQPYVVTAPDYEGQISLGESSLGIKMGRSGLGSPLPLSNGIPLGESSGIEIQQDGAVQIQCSTPKDSKPKAKPRRRAKSRPDKVVLQEPSLEEIPELIKKTTSEEERLNLARLKRRIQTRQAQFRHRQKRIIQIEELQEKVEALLKRQSELEQENAGLRLEIYNLETRLLINQQGRGTGSEYGAYPCIL